MAIDFSKLMDPAYQAQRQAEREEEDRALEAESLRVRGLVNALLDLQDSIQYEERKFVRSIHRLMGALTPKQLDWLEALHKRYCAPAAQAAVTEGGGTDAAESKAPGEAYAFKFASRSRPR